jgi:hypothetical protein
VRPFTNRQIELVTTFADQAVIAIENVRLFDEVQARMRELSESLEQQTATAAILSVISNSLNDTQPVFDATVESGLKLFPGATVVILLADGDKVDAAAIASPDTAGRREQPKQAAHARSAKVKPLHATLARRALLRLDSMATPDPHSLGVPRLNFLVFVQLSCPVILFKRF